MADLLDAIADAGLSPPEHIISDGKIHRFSATGKHGDDAGWYVDFGGGGAFGDWRSGAQHTWAEDCSSPVDREALRAQIRQARAEAKAARLKAQQAARCRAEAIWHKALPVKVHPYLSGKGVNAHGLRVFGNRLLIPLLDKAGGLWSLQSIAPDGSKKFLPGGRTKGRFHLIAGDPAYVGVAEGYATAATLREHTGSTMLVAFSASNLEAIAVTAGAMHPEARLIVWADNDQWTEGNPGVAAARRAALASGAEIKVPVFDGFEGKPTDWNDYFKGRQHGC